MPSNVNDNIRYLGSSLSVGNVKIQTDNYKYLGNGNYFTTAIYGIATNLIHIGARILVEFVVRTEYDEGDFAVA